MQHSEYLKIKYAVRNRNFGRPIRMPIDRGSGTLHLNRISKHSKPLHWGKKMVKFSLESTRVIVSHAIQEWSTFVRWHEIKRSKIPLAEGGSFECSTSPSKYSSVIVAIKAKEQRGRIDSRDDEFQMNSELVSFSAWRNRLLLPSSLKHVLMLPYVHLCQRTVDIDRVILSHAQPNNGTNALHCSFIFLVLFCLFSEAVYIWWLRKIDIFWPSSLYVPEKKQRKIWANT